MQPPRVLAEGGERVPPAVRPLGRADPRKRLLDVPHLLLGTQQVVRGHLQGGGLLDGEQRGVLRRISTVEAEGKGGGLLLRLRV